MKPRTPHQVTFPAYSFGRVDWEMAAKQYPMINCGPVALCGMLGLKPLDVLPLLPRYAERGYTNPSMMAAALRALGVSWKERDDKDCDGHTLTRYGLVRIQWEGPWTAPGANPKWAYRQTHWIGAAEFPEPIPGHPLWVFDVNCGWATLEDWMRKTVPELIALYPRASGTWHATHRWELRFPCRADKDGECIWHACPQVRDGEPHKSGRHCPLDTDEGETL